MHHCHQKQRCRSFRIAFSFMIASCIAFFLLRTAQADEKAESKLEASSVSENQPVFIAEENAVQFGTQRISVSPKGFVFSLASGQCHGTVFLWDKKDGHLSWSDHLKDPERILNPENNEVYFRARYPLTSKEKPLMIEWGLRLHGQMAVIFFRSNGENANEWLRMMRLSISINRTLLIGKTLTADGQANPKKMVPLTSENQTETLIIYSGKPLSFDLPIGENTHLVFNSTKPIGLSLIDRQNSPNGTKAELNFGIDTNKPVDFSLPIRLVNTDDQMNGKDFARRGSVYENIDFRPGGLILPEFDHSRNLVQNPGFELGFRSWTLLPRGNVTSSAVGDYYQIEDGFAYEGSRCLKIITEPGQSPCPLTFFTIPTQPGKNYTFSFYAKTNQPGARLSAVGHTADWPVFAFYSGHNLTNEWQRYTKTFTAPNGALCIGMYSEGKSPQGTLMYVDAVQLEKAEKPTEFTCTPVMAALTSPRNSKTFQPTEDPQLAVVLSGKPNLSGTITINISNLNSQLEKTETFPFSLGASGKSRIELAWSKELPAGIHAVETVIEANLEGTLFTQRDFDRVTIMPFLTNDFRHKNMFCLGAFGAHRGSWNRWAEFLQRIGIGAMLFFKVENEGINRELAARNIYCFSQILNGLNKMKGLLPDPNATVDLKHGFNTLTSEQLSTLEEMAYQNAKANPQVRHWKTFNEPDLSPLLNGADSAQNMKKFIALIRAFAKGIKRADPTIQVMTPDAANMYPTGGIKFIDEFLAAGGGEFCDIAAIHPYRPRPEDPDLDTHVQQLLQVLDKHHFKGEVWFTEGIYHNLYQIPSLSLNVYQGCSSDHFRCRSFSYDLPWSEKIATAFTMRSWLVGLKYATRVKNYVDWSSPSFRVLDYDFTPTALVYASNTLTSLLGNATYQRDIEFGQGIRAYAFTDESNRSVIALWTYLPELDRNKGKRPILHVTTLPQQAEMFYMDGSIAEMKTDLELGPLPLFIRAGAGTLDELCATLENGTFPDGSIKQLYTGMRLASSTEIEVVIRNLLSRPQSGTVALEINGTVQPDQQLTLGDHEEKKFMIPVQMVPQNLVQQNIQLAFQATGKTEPIVQNNCFDTFMIHSTPTPLMPAANLSHWPHAYSMKLPANFKEFRPRSAKQSNQYLQNPEWKGDADLGAMLYTAWDENNLYLAVDVTDDTHNPEDKAGAGWSGDGLQIYFDCWGDARMRLTGGVSSGYGNDDQSFQVWAGSDNTLHVLRDVAPEQQVAFLKTGEFKEPHGTFIRTDSGHSIYQLVFPIREIEPLVIKNGAVFGLAVLVNDRDDEGFRKRALTMTPKDTEPYARPELYPGAVLVKQSK